MTEAQVYLDNRTAALGIAEREALDQEIALRECAEGERDEWKGRAVKAEARAAKAEESLRAVGGLTRDAQAYSRAIQASNERTLPV